MANVLLLSVAKIDPTDPYPRMAVDSLLQSQREDRFRRHQLTELPELADIILFAETRDPGPYFEFVRQHPYFKKYQHKCYIYCPFDFFIPFLPGIYPSIDLKRQSFDWTRSGSYIGMGNPCITYSPVPDRECHIASFFGSIKNSPVRQNMIGIASDNIPFVDTSDFAVRTNTSGTLDEKQQFWTRYADSMQASKFVLCPRGVGVGSIRVFEAMQMGRAPVILSDGWVAPEGPNWEQFSLRVPEAEYGIVPGLLAQHEENASVMGAAAREAWEEWFAPQVIFHRTVETCLQLKALRPRSVCQKSLLVWLQLLRPWHAKNYLRTRLKLYKEKKKLMF